MRPSTTGPLRRLAAALLLVCSAVLLPATGAAAAAQAPPAPVPGTLRPYDISGVYSAGISSGGYMATQLHVAYSGVFGGSAAFASGPYDCAQNSLGTALNACMDTVQDLRLDRLEQQTRQWSAQGLVDPVANLAGDPVYVFSGSGDATVRRPVADALAGFYTRFGARVRYDNTTAAGTPGSARSARTPAPSRRAPTSTTAASTPNATCWATCWVRSAPRAAPPAAR